MRTCLPGARPATASFAAPEASEAVVRALPFSLSVTTPVGSVLPEAGFTLAPSSIALPTAADSSRRQLRAGHDVHSRLHQKLQARGLRKVHRVGRREFHRQCHRAGGAFHRARGRDVGKRPGDSDSVEHGLCIQLGCAQRRAGEDRLGVAQTMVG